MSNSKYYNFDYVAILVDKVCDNLDDFFESLDIPMKLNGRMYVGVCPIHGGDNVSAFNLFPYGDLIRGNWKCRTHKCEEKFGNSFIGFIRGYFGLSWTKAVEWLENYVGGNGDFDLRITNADKIKRQMIQATSSKVIQNKTTLPNYLLTRQKARKLLHIPSPEYVARSFSPAILDKYDIGTCYDINKRMANRTVFPIYDNDYKYMVGCIGRSIYNRCSTCHLWHDTEKPCPVGKEQLYAQKWLSSKDINIKHYLYNYWLAKHYIKEKGRAILVEGAGDVLRLEEAGIHNSVCIFGTEILDKQIILLETLNIMKLLIIADNDAPGIEAANKIKNKYSNIFHIDIVVPKSADIGESSHEEIHNLLKDFI